MPSLKALSASIVVERDRTGEISVSSLPSILPVACLSIAEDGLVRAR